MDQGKVAEGRAGGAFVLPAALDAPAAADLRTQLATAFDEKGGIAVDAHAVDILSTPALQVLLAAARLCHRESTDFTVLNASTNFMEAIADFGAEELLRPRGDEA